MKVKLCFRSLCKLLRAPELTPAHPDGMENDRVLVASSGTSFMPATCTHSFPCTVGIKYEMLFKLFYVSVIELEENHIHVNKPDC